MCSPQWGSQDGSLEASSNQLTSKSVFWQQTRLNLVNICKATARVDRFPWMGVGWGTWLLLILSWLLQASSIKSSQLISEPELWWHTICCGRDDTQSCKINCSCSAGFGQTNQGGNASNGFWICNSRDSKSALNPSSLMSEDVSSWPRRDAWEHAETKHKVRTWTWTCQRHSSEKGKRELLSFQLLTSCWWGALGSKSFQTTTL